MIYQTKYSQINELTKKERKNIQNNFPWLAPKSILNSSVWIGQIVSKEDKGSSVKFCPLCDQPMIVRMLIFPCEHCICFQCSKPDSENCYV